MLDLALSDDGLIDAADVHARSDRRNVEHDLHGDYTAGVHARRDVNVHADVDVLELCVDQGIDADATNAGLKRTRSDGDAVADLERSLRAIKRSYLRILDDLGGGIVVEEICGRRGNGEDDVLRRQVTQRVQVDRARRACGGAHGAACPAGGRACRGGRRQVVGELSGDAGG